ncbi:MAG: glycosyltransferase [Marinilabiliaceae bacterium]|nr:glycosyltransferase [Marinilabiliaceae bacterium]
MKVSIITSCFNRASTIRDTIESVLSQDYADIEYIVVDGASTDGTLEIINEYADRINRIISEKDNGMYDGINKGIKAATGDIVGLLHSDDIFYATDTISRIVYEMKRTSADYLYANGIFVLPTDLHYVVRNWKSGDYSKSKIWHGWLPLHTTVYVKKDIFENSGYYNEQYKIAADTDWQLTCLYSQSLKVTYLDEYVIRMRMGGASTSFKMSVRKWKEDYKAYRSHKLWGIIGVSFKIMHKIPQFFGGSFERTCKRLKLIVCF